MGWTKRDKDVAYLRERLSHHASLARDLQGSGRVEEAQRHLDAVSTLSGMLGVVPPTFERRPQRMFEITPKHLQDLGDAVMLSDGDALYIACQYWLIVVTQADHHIDAQVLDIVRHATANQQTVDWRILNARTIDTEEEKFVPHRGRKARSYIQGSIHQWQRAEPLRKLAERNVYLIFDTAADLTELFQNGDARAVYPEKTSPKERLKEKKREIKQGGSRASFYVFRAGKRVIVVPGPKFRALIDLGFTVTIPSESRSEYSFSIPALGMTLGDVEPMIFGYFMPSPPGSGVFTSDDGRQLYLDAAKICWLTEEQGLERLCSPVNYMADRPGSYQEFIEATENDQWRLGTSFAEGVSVLRWLGKPERYIEDTFEGHRTEGLLWLHKDLLGIVSNRLDEVRRHDVDKYGFGRLERIAKDVKDYCDDFEYLQDQLAPMELSMGLIPEMVEELKDLGVIE